ncbi:MAG TPA: hypothetical protein VLH09_08440, partial [Bryobacteraceae bacterium]|nr:hypothetical protein [Bryobacteraceae bacterium]
MKLPGVVMFSLAVCLLVGCADRPPLLDTGAQEFLRMYEELDQRLGTVSNEAAWNAITDVNERNTGERVGARKALAAFQGSRY